MFFDNWISVILVCTSMVCGSFLVDRAVRRFLPTGKGVVRRVVPFFLFAFVLVHKSWIGDQNPLYLFPFFIAVFLLCYGGPWYARLVTSVIFYVLLEPLCMMADTVMDSLYPVVLYSRQYDGIVALVKLCAFFLLCMLIRRIAPQKAGVHLSAKLWALLGGLGLAPLFSTLSFSLWEPIDHSYDVYAMVVQRIAFTMLPFTVLSALALLVAAVVLARHEELDAANRLFEVQAVYYESLRREQAGVRTLQHDMHNHIAAVQSLLEHGSTDQAKRYLASLSSSPQLAGSVRICENDVANAVLGSKASLMQQEGMQADWDVFLPEQLPLPDIELCALLGNALDNAIEAVRHGQDKRIVLRARADKGVFMLRVENALEKATQKEAGRFKTTKADTKAHGFGLAGMQEIAHRHGGSLEARAENGRFELVVCLSLADA